MDTRRGRGAHSARPQDVTSEPNPGGGRKPLPLPARPRPELDGRGRATGGSLQSSLRRERGFLQSQLAMKLMLLSANQRRGARGLSGCGPEPTWSPQWDQGESVVAAGPVLSTSCWCTCFESGFGVAPSQASRCYPSASRHSRLSGKKGRDLTGSVGY